MTRNMVNAQLFHAHTLKAQFDQNAVEELGQQALKEYDKIIADNQGKNEKVVDQALGFEIKIYEALARNAGAKSEKDKQLRYVEDQRAAMVKRAENSSSNEVKAATHHALAASYWDESYYGNSQQYTTYNRPIPPEVKKKMEPLVEKGLDAHRRIAQAQFGPARRLGLQAAAAVRAAQDRELTPRTRRFSKPGSKRRATCTRRNARSSKRSKRRKARRPPRSEVASLLC